MLQELLAHFRLDARARLGLLLLPAADILRNRNPRSVRADLWTFSAQNRLHARRIEAPLGHQPIRRQSRMQRTLGDPIAIRDITPHHSAQTIDIEMRVLQFQRIKSPFDQTYTSPETIVALRQLEHAAYAAIAKIRENRGHVRMDHRLVFVKTRQTQREADHLLAGKSTESLSAGFTSDDKESRWNDQVLTPGDQLQTHALFILFERRA